MRLHPVSLCLINVLGLDEGLTNDAIITEDGIIKSLGVVHDDQFRLDHICLILIKVITWFSCLTFFGGVRWVFLAWNQVHIESDTIDFIHSTDFQVCCFIDAVENFFLSELYKES